jgi:hypothetical protein
LTNEAPPNLGKFVLGNTGMPRFPQTPGVNRSVVQLFASQGSRPTKVTRNGRPILVSTGYEQARPAFGFTIDIPVGQTQTIVYHLSEPASAGALITRMQPMVVPVALSAHTTTCQS